MPTLVVRYPDGAEEEVDLSVSLTVGRAEGNELVLAEGGVSRQHARFFVEDDVVHVEDLGSANGTWVDGERIDGPARLSAKSQVVIGDYEVSVRPGERPRAAASAKRRPAASSGRSTTAAPRKPGGVAPPRSTKVVPVVKRSGSGAALARRQSPRRTGGPQLRGLSGALLGKTFAVAGTMTVGRVAGNDIVVEDDSVSRKHAELELADADVVLRDLGSANGTTVNGAPITEDTVLSSGDIIQFGVVEVMFEQEVEGGRALARSSAERRRGSGDEARLARAPAGRGSSPEASPSGSRRRPLIIGGAVVGLLLVAGVVGLLVGRGPAPQEVAAPPPPRDPADEIDALLTECRTYSSPELGHPDWARAKVACEKILDIEPIHVEADAILKRIEVEKTCEENLRVGHELVATGRQEEAVERFAKVGAKEGECPTYFFRALDEARGPVKELKKQLGRECKEYASNGKWENAYRRCEFYMRLACQEMELGELIPPPGAVLKLDGRVGRGEWRPDNPLYVNFLKARERLRPNEPMWQCPVIRAFRPPPAAKPIDDELKSEFKARLRNDEMVTALYFYFKGRANEALVPLQKIIENINRASDHDRAKALLQDISSAQNRFSIGSAELSNDRPEKAAPSFKQALEIDERLILGDRAATLSEDEKRRALEKRASYLRRTITEEMSSACYSRGKASADRRDYRQACKIWKLGAVFSRSNIDLLKALTNVCTSKAQATMRQASSCEQLKQVFDFAVDGDGYREQGEEKAAELGCPSEPR